MPATKAAAYGKGEAHGAIAAYWWEPHTPSAAEISIMTALAGQAATALDNARLFAQERDRKASLSSLLEINKKIGALATPESLLTSIAEEAARLLDVDNAGFRLLEGDDLVVAGLAGTAAQTMLRPRIKVGREPDRPGVRLRPGAHVRARGRAACWPTIWPRTSGSATRTISACRSWSASGPSAC